MEDQVTKQLKYRLIAVIAVALVAGGLLVSGFISESSWLKALSIPFLGVS